MRTPSLLILGALVLAPLAKADKFWLEPKDAQSQVEGSLPTFIEGVLLGQDDQQYHLRVEGGELWLAKSLVQSIDTDDLTVAAIEASEQAQADALAEATQERVAVLAASRRDRSVQAVEASASGGFDDPVPPLQPGAYVYDPVVNRALPEGMSDAALMLELKFAYDQTGDRTYIKLLRKLRRLR